MTTTDDVQKAGTPEDIAKLFVQFANAGDADAVAALYEEDAVMAFPPDPSPWVAKPSAR